jgi:hypothetical protein
MFAFPPSITLAPMQLIQIGEVRQKTVLDFILEMAERQFAEIERLKAAAQNHQREKSRRRTRPRCNPAVQLG